MKPPVENRTLTGTADAKGEMGCVQAKKGVFRWEMLLFHPREHAVFPLKISIARTSHHSAGEYFLLWERCRERAFALRAAPSRERKRTLRTAHPLGEKTRSTS